MSPGLPYVGTAELIPRTSWQQFLTSLLSQSFWHNLRMTKELTETVSTTVVNTFKPVDSKLFITVLHLNFLRKPGA